MTEPEREFTRTEWDSSLQKWSSGFPRLRPRVAEWRCPVRRKLATNGNKDTWDPRTPGGGEASATTGSVTATEAAGSQEGRGGAGSSFSHKGEENLQRNSLSEWNTDAGGPETHSRRYSGRASGLGEGGGLGFRKGCLQSMVKRGGKVGLGFPVSPGPRGWGADRNVPS